MSSVAGFGFGVLSDGRIGTEAHEVGWELQDRPAELGVRREEGRSLHLRHSLDEHCVGLKVVRQQPGAGEAKVGPHFAELVGMGGVRGRRQVRLNPQFHVNHAVLFG